MLRRRRQRFRARRYEEGPAGLGSRYLLREKMLSIGDDWWIEDERGGRVLEVDAKVLRVRDTIVLKDPGGAELLKLRKRLLRGRSMEIERGEATVATVRKARFTPLRDRFHIELVGGRMLQAEGDVLGHEFQITADGVPVANVSKRWFRVRDSYGVAIAPGQDDVLILAIAVCIDHLGD